MSDLVDMGAGDVALACLALLFGYVIAVAITVAAGALYCLWAARHYGALGMQSTPDDLRAFAPRPALSARLHGLMVEIACQAFAFLLRAARDLRLLRAPVADPRSTPVLVVPGYVENAGTMWWLARRLARAGFNVTLVEFPSTTCAIEQNVAYLAACIEQVRAARGGEPVAVVAHSMGGVIARTLMLSREDHGVRTLVAIGSPFRGTHLARLGARLHVGHCVGQVVPGSDFMRRFPPTLACPVPILSLIAPQENIVTPLWSAAIEGARIHVLAQFYGHEAPLFVRAVSDEIQAWLLAHGVTRALAADGGRSEPAARGAVQQVLHREEDEQHQQR